MYLKTYAKFTFCIKSQRHVSDENFFVLLYTPGWQNFFLQCLKYIRQKIHFYLLLKFSIFSLCTSKHTMTFSIIFLEWLHSELWSNFSSLSSCIYCELMFTANSRTLQNWHHMYLKTYILKLNDA